LQINSVDTSTSIGFDKSINKSTFQINSNQQLNQQQSTPVDTSTSIDFD